MEWKAQYKHPNWQRKRLEALEAANFTCQLCGDKESQLHVHHKRYVKGRMIWEYANTELSVLCEPCHLDSHDQKNLFSRLIAESPIASHGEFAPLLYGYLSSNKAFSSSVESLGLHEFHDADPFAYSIGYVAGELACLNIHNIHHLCGLTKDQWEAVVKFVEGGFHGKD
jgi:hypothetical protein